MNNKLIIIMGVSGAGKATMMQYIRELPNIEIVRSYCTRPMRPGEINGEIYHFISKEEFEKSLADGVFFEYTFQRGEAYYGTKYKDVQDAFSTGKIPIKEIDMEGILKMREAHILEDQYITIFLDIPNGEIIRRITKRASLDEAAIQRRLDKANEERKTLDICDYVVDANRPVEEVRKSVLEIMGLSVL